MISPASLRMSFRRVPLSPPPLPDARIVAKLEAVQQPRRISNQSSDPCSISSKTSTSSALVLMAVALATLQLLRCPPESLASLDRLVEAISRQFMHGGNAVLFEEGRWADAALVDLGEQLFCLLTGDRSIRVGGFRFVLRGSRALLRRRARPVAIIIDLGVANDIEKLNDRVPLRVGQRRADALDVVLAAGVFEGNGDDCLLDMGRFAVLRLVHARESTPNNDADAAWVRLRNDHQRELVLLQDWLDDAHDLVVFCVGRALPARADLGRDLDSAGRADARQILLHVDVGLGEGDLRLLRLHLV